MKKIFITLISAFLILIVNNVQSQTIYRSLLSGNWGTFTTWERSTDNGGTWNPAISGQLPTTNTSVIVQSPNTVTIDASGKNCVNLTIQAGAKLTSGSNAFQLSAGAGSSGTAGIVGTIQVDGTGTLGGVGDMTVFQLPATASQVTFTGAGTISIGRIRVATGNSNNPASGTVGHANDARIIINNNINLNMASNYALAALASTQSATDTVLVTINAGKTVVITDPTAFLHNSSLSSGVVSSTGGRYSYNINGVLDLTANTSTTGGTSFIPYGNAGSSLTLNVGGTLKLGAYFRADTVANSAAGANIALNINNGGLIDASLTTNFIVGKTNTAVGNIFFVESGTGALKRTIPGDGSVISFPIGTSINSYSPVSISNTGTADVFTVNVQNTITNAPPDPTKVVNKQWTLTEDTLGGTIGTVKLSWLATDQAAGFDPAQTISILRWTGSTYEAHLATVTGAGTLASPYVATASGFIAFSPFIVANFVALPISFENAKAYQKNNGVQVDWSIANENADKYIVEKSTDGNSFFTAGIVPAQVSTTLTNNYSWFDANPISGNNFYRIKAVDRDQSVKYTSVMKITIGSGKPALVVSPNPVKGSQVNLQLTNIVKGTYSVSLYNSSGQKVFTDQIKPEGGSSSQSLQLPSTVKPGTYNLQLNNGGDVKLTKTIVIE